MNAVETAHALGGAHKEGRRRWRCRCPLCGGHNLVMGDGRTHGVVLVTCWNGCDRRDVLAELRRLTLLAGGDYRARTPRDHRDTSRKDDLRRIAQARAIWDAAAPALNTPVARYLAGRGITIPPPASLRWVPRCWHSEARQHLPAMIALVEHATHGVVGVHRTYLRSEGNGKADIQVGSQKKSLGPIAGSAVRFGMPVAGEWFAVAEGIETTLSVAATCSMPAWAALSAGGIRRLILPLEATHVVICADRDARGVGQNAAADAAQRWLADGRHVRVALPPHAGADFNDLLTEETRDVA
jgi:hypothetical protein